MGLIAQEIKELRRMVRLMERGQIEKDEVDTRLKIYKETHKRAKLIFDVYVASNSPHLIEKRLHGLNILSKGEFVQLPGDVEVEMVQCPDQGDRLITRSECLSYSGDTENHAQCSSCENFAITRNLLLPKN